MKNFAKLVLSLEQAERDVDKIELLGGYFKRSPAGEAAWAIFLLLSWKPRSQVDSRKLKKWVIESAGIPDWLYQESLEVVGEVAETIALLFPDSGQPESRSLQFWAEQRLALLSTKKGSEKQQAILNDWKEMDNDQRLIWNQLLSGEFHSPVSQDHLVAALARIYNIDEKAIAKRLAVDWHPSPEFYRQLISRESDDE